MDGEETDQNESADTTCLMHRNASFEISDLREKLLVYRNWNGPGTLGPVHVSWVVPDEVGDDGTVPWIECMSCGKRCTSRDDFDSHARSCEMSEGGVMGPPQVTRSDSTLILNTEECDKSNSSGTEENVVEVSRATVSSPNNGSVLSGLEIDREGNGVGPLSIECSKATKDTVISDYNYSRSLVPYQTSYEIDTNGSILSGLEIDREAYGALPDLSVKCWKATNEDVISDHNYYTTHVPHQTLYEIENNDGKVLGVVYDDNVVAEGISLLDEEVEAGIPLPDQQVSEGIPMPDEEVAEGIPLLDQQVAEGVPLLDQQVAEGVPLLDQQVAEGIPMPDKEVEAGIPLPDQQVAEGIPKPNKENASISTEKIEFLAIKLSRKLSWIQCTSCGTFLPNEAKLEYHVACRHSNPQIFDDTFDDRDKAGEEKEAEGSVEQSVVEEDNLFEHDDVLMTMTPLFQFETCNDFISEDDYDSPLRSSGPNLGQEEPRSSILEEDEDEDWISCRLSNPQIFDDTFDDRAGEEKEAEGSDQQSVVEEDNLFEHDDVRMTMTPLFQFETCNDFDFSEDDYDSSLRSSGPNLGQEEPRSSRLEEDQDEDWFGASNFGSLDLIRETEKDANPSFVHGEIFNDLHDLDLDQGQESQKTKATCLNRKTRGKRGTSAVKKKTCDSTSRRSKRLLGAKDKIGLVRQDSDSENTPPSSNRKSRRKQVPQSDQNQGNSCDSKSDDNVTKKRGKARKTGNKISSPASAVPRPNKKYRHQCPECYKWLQGKSNLLFHMRTHTGEKPFECPTCSRKFTAKSSLQLHQKNVHNGEKPFECDMCERKFSQKGNLKSHRELHFRLLPLECHYCPLRFGHEYHRTPHERTHKGPRPYTCDQCPATFASNGSLQRHRFFHTGVRPFKCNTCSQSFQTKYILRGHEATHTDQFPFECISCSKAFRRVYELRTHSLVHLKERPFKCDLCPKAYIRKRELEEHKFVHTGERPHKCDQCPLEFRTKSQLTAHKKQHSSTQFKCDLCSKTFKLEKYLRAHKPIHSYKYPYKCDTCETIFKAAITLHYHIRKGCDPLGKGK